MAKAAEGNTAALGKLGIGLTSAQLKTMSMDEITAKLADTFENQASAKADTFQGKLTRLQIAFDEGKETVGAYILDAITPLVTLIVEKVIPAIEDFTSNIGEKLRPVLEFIQPILKGLRSAFDSVKNSLADNNDELQPFYNLMKNIATFARDTLAPVLGKTLGVAFSALGKIVAEIIDGFATFVNQITKIYNAIKGIIDVVKGAGSAVGNFFSGSNLMGSADSVDTTKPYSIATPPKVLNSMGSGNVTNITVNGAIDSESTARQIVDVLNQSSYRGTLGAGALLAI
jgi:hypothetical protein